MFKIINLENLHNHDTVGWNFILYIFSNRMYLGSEIINYALEYSQGKPRGWAVIFRFAKLVFESNDVIILSVMYYIKTRGFVWNVEETAGVKSPWNINERLIDWRIILKFQSTMSGDLSD